MPGGSPFHLRDQVVGQADSTFHGDTNISNSASRRGRPLMPVTLQKNAAGESLKKSASLRMCALLGSRLPLSTAEATLREPKTGSMSA